MNLSSSPFKSKICKLAAILLSVSAVRASVLVQEYYRMGEGENSPTGSTTTIVDWTGFAHLSSDNPVSYSSDVSPDAALRADSSTSVHFPTEGAALQGNTTINNTTDNFGVEAWVKPAGGTATQTIICNGTAGTNGFQILQVGNTLRGAIGGSVFGSAVVTPGGWIHVALIRSQGTTTLYVNRVPCGTTSAEAVLPTGSLILGASGFSPLTNSFTGSLDEVRFFSFAAGAFTTDDLLPWAGHLNVQRSDGTSVMDGGVSSFDDTPLGSASDLTLTATNKGLGSLSVSTTFIDGADPSQFSIVTNPNGVLASDGSRSFTVRFSPFTPGKKTAVLHLRNSDANQTLYDITLTGQAGSPDTISVEQIPGTPLITGKVVDGPTTPGLEGVKSVVSGQQHLVGLKFDGTVAAWGLGVDGQTAVPSGLAGVTHIGAGSFHSLAVKADGTVVGWGRNTDGQTDVPPGLSSVIAVAGGVGHSVALKSDGTVVAWGLDANGQTDVPAGLSGVTAIAAGNYHTVALKADGSVVAWGLGKQGQINIPATLKSVIGIGAGSYVTTVLKADGTVGAYGFSFIPQTGGTAIFSGFSQTMFLKADGNWFSVLGSVSDPYTKSVRGFGLGGLYAALLTDTPVPFGEQTVGFQSDPKTFTIRNSGGLPVGISSVTLSGGNAADFKLDTTGMATSLPAITGQTTFAVSCKPSATGTRWTSLKIASNDPEKPFYYIYLTASSINPAAKFTLFKGTTADPQNQMAGDHLQGFAFNFPDATAAGDGVSQTFTIKNEGHRALGFYYFDLAGPDRADFAFVSRSEDTVQPGESMTFTMIFRPEGDGPRNAWIEIDTDEPESYFMNLGGVAAAPQIELETAPGSPLFSGKATIWGDSVAANDPPSGLAGVERICSGPFGNVALLSSGRLVSWGYSASAFPEVAAGTPDVRAISYSGNLAVLRNDSTVGEWDSSGQPAVLPPGLTGVVAIETKYGHTLALKSDGKVVGWGDNSWGQSTVPVGLANVIAIAAGNRHSLAVKSDGTVVAWGLNGNGQTNVPSGLTGVVSVEAGDLFSIALKSDGTVASWGDPRYAAPDGLRDIVSISAGAEQAFGMKSDGSLRVWGYGLNHEGIVPVGLTGVRSIAAGAGRSAAVTDSVVDYGPQVTGLPLTKTFTVRNSGSMPLNISGVSVSGASASDFTVDTAGMLTTLPAGTGAATTFRVTFKPGSTGFGKRCTLQILSNDDDEAKFRVWLTGDGIQAAPRIGVEQMAGLPLNQGSIVVWGDEQSQALNIPAGLDHVKSLAGDGNSMIALKTDGTVVSWGYGYSGQLEVPLGLQNVTAISQDFGACLALRSDGSVVPWGSAMAPPSHRGTITAISAGSGGHLALRGDGTILEWGGYFGSPPQGLSGVVAIPAVASQSMALKSDGTVVAWPRTPGDNDLIAPTLTNISAIAAGGQHKVALRSDGTVFAWGDDTRGQTDVPVGLSGVVQIAAGDYHTVALKDDGTVVSWGTENQTPTQPPVDLRGVRAVFAGGPATMVLVDPVVDLGSGFLGISGGSQMFTVRNSGVLPLHVTGISASGGTPGDFTVNPAGAADPISPDGTGTFSVTFTPGGVGSRLTTLKVLSDDPQQGTFYIHLAGFGLAGPTSLESWRTTWFGTSTGSGNASDLADPNHNGIPNLLEYALGGDPLGNTTGLSILPRLSSNAQGHSQFSFTRDLSRVGVTLTIQASDTLDGVWTDLATSTGGGAFTRLAADSEVTETGAGQYHSVVVGDSFSASDPAHPHRFLRLKASAP